MKHKNLFTYFFVVLVIITIIVLGYFFIKPSQAKFSENPYSIKMDSLAEIPKDDFCEINYSYIQLDGSKSEAITVDKHNNLYVSYDNKIRHLDIDGNMIFEINTKDLATALTYSDEKLTAAFANEISIYDAEGKELINWKMDNKKSYITSLTSTNGKIYAADAYTAKVYCFSESGKLLKTIGQNSDKYELDFFSLPSYYFDVAVGKENTIWVSNPGRHKLVQFNTEGQIISSWGKTSSALDGFCGCCNPSNFALLSDGSFVTSEKGIVRIKKHSKDGHFTCAIAGHNKFLKGAQGLDITVDASDRIFVLEPEAMKIHIFEQY
jgi:outer membrane protein assembly factor BamB